MPAPASVLKLAPTSSRQSSTMSQSRAPARTPSPAATEECFRCGRTGHRPQDCLCSDMECHACGKKGHISRACPRKKSDGAKKTCATHAVEETSEDEVVFALHNCTTAETHKIKSSRTEPIWIHPKVNGCQLQMELDTGSALTILPASMFHEHFDLPLQPTSTMLKPYAGDHLRPKGVFRAHVCYNGQEFEADAYVVDSDGPALFGRDWLQNIVFDWRSLHNIKANATSAPLSDGTRWRLDALRSRYAAVFGSDRGHLQPSRGHLTLRDGAQPKFLKARPLPYALRDLVGRRQELPLNGSNGNPTSGYEANERGAADHHDNATRPAAHRADLRRSLQLQMICGRGHAQLQCTQSMFACIDQHVDQSMFHCLLCLNQCALACASTASMFASNQTACQRKKTSPDCDRVCPETERNITRKRKGNSKD